MTYAEQVYKQFVEWKATNPSMEQILMIHKVNKKILKNMIKTATTKLILHFLKWINNITEYDFFIRSLENGRIILLKKDFEGLLTIKLCKPNHLMEEVSNKGSILEIVTINSTKKGEGYKMMKPIIYFAQKQNIPVVLWTETEENVKYFERYGFKNYGRRGDDQEYLMILI